MSSKTLVFVTALGAAFAISVASPAFSEEMGAAQGAMEQASNPVAYESQKLIGKEVTNQQGETLGKIRNLAIGSNGEVTYAVLGFGGVAGMREKDVAVPFSQLQISPNQDRITLDVRKDRITSEFSAFEDVRKSETMQRK